MSIPDFNLKAWAIYMALGFIILSASAGQIVSHARSLSAEHDAAQRQLLTGFAGRARIPRSASGTGLSAREWLTRREMLDARIDSGNATLQIMADRSAEDAGEYVAWSIGILLGGTMLAMGLSEARRRDGWRMRGDGALPADNVIAAESAPVHYLAEPITFSVVVAHRQNEPGILPASGSAAPILLNVKSKVR